MPKYIKHDEGTFASLTKQQKEAVGLLSIGTFLEYFDLMLYIHMAVLLNELFFPKFDSDTTNALLNAFSFCSIFIFRPIGALIFGWFGDNIGRKTTVILTTFLMSFSCIIIATLPTYAQIGISASYVFLICRIIQGMSSMGEIIGADLYLIEMTRPPIQYPIVSLPCTCSALGGFAALGIASLVTSIHLNWRYAFWFGSGIAMIGAIARNALRETPEFVDAKKYIKNKLKPCGIDSNSLIKNPIYNEHVNKSKALALFSIECAYPLCFYYIYIYCGNVLRNSFGYTAEQVISHNFIISIILFLSYVLLLYLSYHIYPLLILKIRLLIFSIFIIFSTYLLSIIDTPFQLLLIQLSLILVAPDLIPAQPILYKYFPILKRFTYTATLYALSRALVHFTTSFGIIYLEKYYGHYGILVIALPIIIMSIRGVFYFEKLEKQSARL